MSAAPSPVVRKLRVFAVDPGMTARFETAVINEMTVHIPWEQLGPGPAGEYVAVIDEDERGQELPFGAVDLDSVDLLAQDGLPPSDGSPLFRQQMVYTVAMKTIRNFERALGRPAHWAPAPENGGPATYQPVLRLYPHFNRNPNAFYNPQTGVCFGYFEAGAESLAPGTLVFTCLSQDVIAHAVTHALLTGMNLNFEDWGSDDQALHEAFADLVALFQHFGESEVLREQIRDIRGDLHKSSALGAVALQMGQATGSPDGIRNAFRSRDENGVWGPRTPDPNAYANAPTEVHDRGDLLVGVVFDAFRKIYEARIADLRRIATKGTGVFAEGDLHPDLVNRLTREASDAARHVLHMCIRALDYLPPIQVTFADYLRALVTADHDLVPRDDRHYRVAFIDAFRAYGIRPLGVGTLSVDTLLWPRPPEDSELSVIEDFVRELSSETTYWNLPPDREARWHELQRWKDKLATRLRDAAGNAGTVAGIDLSKDFEVCTLDIRERAGPAGTLSQQWVVKIIQADGPAGCTLLVDADSGAVRYLIEKPAPGEEETDLLKRASASAARVPTERCLRVFAFDPSFGVQLETAGINEVTLRVPWERDAAGANALEKGPVGEYLEVIDHDPASGAYYAPVDLNDVAIVAQDGLAPSESNPQFHQQMVYAVAMRVIRDFERALGRLVLWAPHRPRDRQGKVLRDDYVQRLRIHPHALREANAYYSPQKKALLFGYFPGPNSAGGSQLTVFTCLSHDIIAHEITHALLDGKHQRFNEPSNPDVLAFHEAFADIVALFEHFSLPDVLLHQIAATRGDLQSQNRLGELAQQFGQAIGRRGALRSAIGETDPETGRWRERDPDPEDYERLTEPHERGSLLVAAVFDAFLTIYKSQVADLLRIATEGTGVLPAGQLHPDLVRRLAGEAADAAQSVLHMCIRALDYCPPVDITFGDYLRAIVTADFEKDPVDARHRRVAFVEAFRRYGIVPDDVRTLAVDGLLWRPAEDEGEDLKLGEVKSWARHMESWSLSRDREKLFDLMTELRRELHGQLAKQIKDGSALPGGMDPERPFEVHSIRPSVRTDWSERPRLDWVIELTQKGPDYLADHPDTDGFPPFRGGCTLLVDAVTGRVRYSIKKPLSDARADRQRRYVLDEGNRNLAATYFQSVTGRTREPFAMVHRL